MNSTEQKQRHTAVTELRGEMEALMDALLKSVGQQLEQEHQAWTAALGQAVSYDRERDEMSCSGCRSLRRDMLGRTNEQEEALTVSETNLMIEIAELRIRITAFKSLTFWGRLRWLVLGR